MKILKLKTKNINSLEGENEIDFSSSAFQNRIFAIVGETGAGKSTLLDAITLALYAQTTRLKSKVEALLSSSQSDSYAEVTFEVAGEHYRSRFEQKVVGDKREMQMYLFGQTLLAKGIDEVVAKVEQLIGVDFNEFTSSMVLSQGLFESFLKAPKAERLKLLEKINNTERYAKISKQTYERAKKEEETFKQMETLLKNLVYLEPEKLKGLQERKAILEAEKKSIDLEKVLKTYSEKLAFEKLSKEVKVQKSKLEALQESLVEKQLEEKLYHDFINFSTAEQRKIEEARLIDSELEFSAKNLQKIQEEEHKLQKELSRIEETLLTSEKNLNEFHVRKTLLQKELNGFSEMRHLKENYTLIQSKFNERLKLQEELRNFKMVALEELDETPLVAKIAKLQEEILSLDKVIKSQNREKIQQQSLILEKKIAKLLERERLVKSQEESLALKEELSSKLEELRVEKAELSEVKETLLEMVQQLEEKLNLEQKIINYERDREALKENEPCPLCGSLEHPLFSQEVSLSKTEKILKEKKSLYEALLLKYESNKEQLIKSETALEELEKRLEEERKNIMKLGKLEGDVNLLKNEQHGFLKSLQTIEAQQAELSLKQRKLTTLQEELIQLKAKIEKNKNHRKIEEQMALKIQELGYYLIKTLRLYQVELNEHSMSLLQSKKEQFEKLSQELNALEQQMYPLEGEKMQQLSRKSYVEEALRSLKKRLSIQECDMMMSKQKRLSTIGDKVITEYSLELERKREEQQERYNQFLLLKNQFEEQKHHYFRNLEKLETQQKLKLVSLETLEKEKNRLQEKLATLNQELGSINTILSQERENLEKRASQERSLEEQEQVVKEWKQLNELIGSADGQKYQSYVQSLTFGSLIELANAHLKKLNPRYLLALKRDSELELEVVDLAHNGTRRAVHTLSGGESFVVSLALSLGLLALNSDTLELNTLFLDEGFETLDEESLKLVLHTLSQLKNEGKIIGLISHLPLLKEQISTQIKIEKQANGVSGLAILGV